MRDGKHVILIVDDDPDVRDVIGLVLAQDSYAVIGAENARQGLERYKKTQPDLIIVDLMMEEVDSGTHLVRELQALGNTAPVYLLSSVGDGLSMTVDHSELGVRGILQKPLLPSALLALVRATLT
jgi:two-component system alkaline phosphatase synthesis response regulator PhoP